MMKIKIWDLIGIRWSVLAILITTQSGSSFIFYLLLSLVAFQFFINQNQCISRCSSSSTRSKYTEYFFAVKKFPFLMVTFLRYFRSSKKNLFLVVKKVTGFELFTTVVEPVLTLNKPDEEVSVEAATSKRRGRQAKITKALEFEFGMTLRKRN